jgi:hypothetical protein
MKTLKVLALAGLMTVGGFTAAHAQALTSATTLAAEAPMIVGIGATVATVQVSSSVATSLTLQIPNPRAVIGAPSCVTYDITGAGPLARRYVYDAVSGVVTVNAAPSQVSGTVAVNDQVRCTAVVRP